MKKIGIIIFIFIIVFNLSCQEEKEEIYPPLTIEEISMETLWKRITEESNYKTYQFWPNHEGFKRGQFPHGAFHKIYINNTLCNHLPDEERTLIDGSIIVKENYDAQKNFLAITVMAKVKGYHPESNNWFWAKYDREGNPLAVGPEGKEGVLNGCIECHGGKKDNDYVIVHPLNKPLE